MTPQQQLWLLEAEMRRISERGADFQGRVEACTKSDTGDYSADVVTEADTWVQQELLQTFLGGGLGHCQLIAEEDTPLVAQFPQEAEYQLLIDPIDGTRRFVEGLPYFATIVSLRRGAELLYCFCYYPKLRWWVRLWESSLWEISGRLPLDLSQTEPVVAYTSGSLQEHFSEWQAERPDYAWVKGSAHHPCGSKLLYLSGAVAGYACYKPNLYDGTMVYHYAHIRKHRLHTSPDFDLARRERNDRGLYVPGQYLCYQESAPPC